MNRYILHILLIIAPLLALAQLGVISGQLNCQPSDCDGAYVIVENQQNYSLVDSTCQFKLNPMPFGEYRLIVFVYGFKTLYHEVKLDSVEKKVELELIPLSEMIEAVVVQEERLRALGLTRLSGVQGTTVYEGKKTELVELKSLQANLAVNNPRQVFGKLTGVHIWESDAAGLQLGVGGRGLSPNRSANFNTRQNGYDISADALGYPESYYSPPLEAIDRIEVLRGAASLQYGTQFGGMVNFVSKEGGDKPIRWVSKQTLGSYGFWSSFNSADGTIAKGKLKYYTYHSMKTGRSWRENSQFEAHTAGLRMKYQFNPRWSSELEYTYMNYLAQQPGGLTDAQFESDARVSLRNRNWFKVNWNLAAWNLNFRPDSQNQFNLRTFGLLAQRLALGNLERINRMDSDGPRNLIDGQFLNIGQEFRWRHDIKQGNKTHTLVMGYRLYHGTSNALQGDANAESGPDFYFLNPNNVEGSAYDFINDNVALFAEFVWRVSPRLSITPGMRAEYIQTQSEGYYRQIIKDGAGNVVVDNRFDDERFNKRNFVIAGLGTQYKLNSRNELYANVSQNYRAINFTDMRVNNPNLRIDSNLRDEKGFTADLGIRGERKGFFIYELTAFYLFYQGKIGQVLRQGNAPLYLDHRYRTNVSDAQNMGLEAMTEWNLLRYLPAKRWRKQDLNLFVNGSYIHARYINSEDASIQGNEVEMVPTWMFRSGLRYRYGRFRFSAQGNYTSSHFSDATNSIRTASAVEGIIPSYFVMDLSMGYTHKIWSLDVNVNNLLNARYFTRRADSYPGPGIIPAEARAIFVTLGIKLD
ncbi:MAG: TonB-dependent receptor [Bacteroidetes bacterium]|nr:MAG: TonB-dependent receptor [Bacteroidota bacterium]